MTPVGLVLLEDSRKIWNPLEFCTLSRPLDGYIDRAMFRRFSLPPDFCLLRIALLPMLCVALNCVCACRAENAESLIDGYGRMQHVAVGEGWLEIRTDVRIPSLGWKNSVTLGDAPHQGLPLKTGAHTWQSEVKGDNGLSFSIEQKVTAEKDKVTFDVTVTSNTDAALEGVFFWIDFAEDQFAGGSFSAGRRVNELPLRRADYGSLSQGYADRLLFVDSASKMWSSVTLSRPSWVVVRDQRQYGENFSAFIEFHDGDLYKGRSSNIRVVIEPGGVTDDLAFAKIDTTQTHGKLLGFGGNYAFNLDSPITRYTLDNLNISLARTAMALNNWQPEKPPEAAGAGAKANWDALVRNDKDGSELRQEFEMMAELSRRKIPFIASIWSLPPWMYTLMPKDADATKNTVDSKMWPAAVECISSYLQYAKEKYHAEPDYLSFNEPDIGIKVLLTAEEHRAAIISIGEHLEKLGFKTRMLLGDVGNPRGTVEYAVKAGDDATLEHVVGAVAFHSWGGGSPKDFAEWSDTAAHLKRPLFVTEAGVDPDAWRWKSFSDFEYGLRELSQYQRILQYARPQAVLYWEYTKDYGLLAPPTLPAPPTPPPPAVAMTPIPIPAMGNGVNGGNAGKPKLNEAPAKPLFAEKLAGSELLQMSARFCYQKQFADLTPPGSEYLNVSTDRPGIQLSAFRLPAEKDDAHGITVHIANPRWQRKLVLQGLPAAIKLLYAVHTTQDEFFKELTPVEVHDGRLEVMLPSQSMTTLTTLPIPKLKRPE